MSIRSGLIVLVVLAICASNVAAASNGIVVGSGTTAWGEAFKLSVSSQKTPYGTFRCLDYGDAHGGGSACPLEKPTPSRIDVQTSANCTGKQLALYGTLSPQVASVVVRFVGGRSLVATRFDPNPQVDPDIAYWYASTRGLIAVRSITAVGPDGSVLARNRESGNGICEDDHHPYRGRRWTVGRATGVNGTALRLDAYRRSVERDGQRVPALCLGLAARARGTPHSDSAGEACGLVFERDTKALELFAAGDGCRAGRMLYAYGLARRKVARIVIRSSAGWTVVQPRVVPRWLRAPGRAWFAVVHWPASGVVIEAQDRHGRSIAKHRVRPLTTRFGSACSTDSIGGAV